MGKTIKILIIIIIPILVFICTKCVVEYVIIDVQKEIKFRTDQDEYLKEMKAFRKLIEETRKELLNKIDNKIKG